MRPVLFCCAFISFPLSPCYSKRTFESWFLLFPTMELTKELSSRALWNVCSLCCSASVTRGMQQKKGLKLKSVQLGKRVWLHATEPTAYTLLKTEQNFYTGEAHTMHCHQKVLSHWLPPWPWNRCHQTKTRATALTCDTTSCHFLWHQFQPLNNWKRPNPFFSLKRWAFFYVPHKADMGGKSQPGA